MDSDLPSTRRAWTLVTRPEGRAVRENDFCLVELAMPDLRDGQFLTETLFLSVAPVMRNYMLDGAGIEDVLPIGGTMRGRGVARVVASRNAAFPVGAMVQGKLGWQTHTVLDGSPKQMTYLVRPHDGIPVSAALGALGVTGYTAYFGLYDVGALRAGETVFVSAATGGVGSVVGPLAKRLGCRVIGTCSTDEKAALLTERLGYDAAMNYRQLDVEAALGELAPDGIDVMFDNVGGAVLDAGLAHLNRYGRVVLCGRISQYLVTPDDQYRLRNWHCVGRTRSRMEGFFIYDFQDRFSEAESELAAWIADGTLPLLEDVLDGIERVPEALIRLYEGANRGKQLVRVAE